MKLRRQRSESGTARAAKSVGWVSSMEGIGGGTEGHVWFPNHPCVEGWAIQVQDSTPSLPDSGCSRVKCNSYKRSTVISGGSSKSANTAWHKTNWDATIVLLQEWGTCLWVGGLPWTYYNNTRDWILHDLKGRQSLEGESHHFRGAWEGPWAFHISSLTEHKAKPTQVQGQQPITELPARTKVNPLQHKRLEFWVSITYYMYYDVYHANKKLLDMQRSRNIWPTVNWKKRH